VSIWTSVSENPDTLECIPERNAYGGESVPGRTGGVDFATATSWNSLIRFGVVEVGRGDEVGVGVSAELLITVDEAEAVIRNLQACIETIAASG
jgi:hypothetical protein